MGEIIVLEKATVAAAFAEWNKRECANPEQFQDKTEDHAKWGHDCAAYLFEIIDELEALKDE